ncbi:MAG TPA: efflux RND transporter permease subunit [Thermoanaerobaculia bacterium]|nr:efflux RND transporter permease subunit [Thermoanaerobaculia bacterium]
MTGRPIARLVATLGLLVLGAAALARLPLEYFPRQSFPELNVGLALRDAWEPGVVAREWVEPIESAIRSLGRVRATGGEVRADGAELTVRFDPGTDPDRKAARLESELARLRPLLPEGSELWVTPASQQEGEFLAIVWLSGARDDTAARAAAEDLRSIPGVRAVELFGPRDEEVRITLPGTAVDPGGLAEIVRREAEQSLAVPALGWTDRAGRRWPVVGKTGGDLRSLPIPLEEGAVPLGSLAAVRSRQRPARAEVRFRGEPARALFVYRTHGASLLVVDRALRERLRELPGGLRGTVAWSDADPLRILVRRLAWGGLLAVVLAAALGALLAGRGGALALGLAIPAALAAAANAFLLAGVPANVTTITALVLGVLALVPLAALRFVRRSGFWPWGLTAIAAAACVPIAVALASAELGPLLAQPALALFLTVGAGVLAVAITPRGATNQGAMNCAPTTFGGGRRGAIHRAPMNRAPRRTLQTSLRDPGTAVLFAITGAYVLIALFGAALVPRPGDLEPDQGNLTLSLRLPEGTTLEETVGRVAKTEEVLSKAEEIESFWSYATPGTARIVAEVRPGDRSPAERVRLITRLRYGLAAVGPVEITSGSRATGGNRGGRFVTDLEDKPETDEDALFYRAVLRSADLASLRTGRELLQQRLETLKVPRSWIQGETPPTVQLVLQPWPGTAPAEAEALAAALRRKSSPPEAVPLPAGPGGAERFLTVVPAGTPDDPDRAIPQVADLLGRPVRLGERQVTPAAALALSEEVVRPRVARQSGRFVIPIEIRFFYNSEEVRKGMRRSLDRGLSQLALPPGCGVDRPPLEERFWHQERLRLLVLALAVPILLLAVATCRLDSFVRGLAALAPLSLGLLAALPLISWSLQQADELTVFALAASLALTLPSAAAAATGTGTFREATGLRLYRGIRQQAPWMLGSIPVLLLALAAPTLGADPTELRWSVPLRAAAVASSASLAASALLAPALLLAAARLRNRDPEEVRRRRRPPVWNEPGLPVLEVRSLTKLYAGRVPALSRVSFTLEPGIIGLLGPNGAGKTTLLRILTGLLNPSRGHVLYRGIPISPDNLAQYRRRIGFLPQEFNAYPDFTAEQFLDHWARERGLADSRQRREEIERLLEAVDLTEHTRRKVRDFSGGMRQRIGIARALLAAPPILIVDEPTTGLDVESRNRFRQTLLEQAADRIVVFSTHIASDVEAAALRILLLHRGRLRFDGTPEDLVALARGRVFRALVDDADLLDFSHQYRVTSRVRILQGIEVRALARPGDPLAGAPVEPNLEEAYLAEIDLADAEAGQLRRVERFGFLDLRKAG